MTRDLLVSALNEWNRRRIENPGLANSEQASFHGKSFGDGMADYLIDILGDLHGIQS